LRSEKSETGKALNASIQWTPLQSRHSLHSIAGNEKVVNLDIGQSEGSKCLAGG
jgi:hypothetical protein